MTRNVLELRSALHRLADQAPTVDDLDHRPWTGTTQQQPARWRPTGRMLAIAGSTAAVAVVLGAVGFGVFGGDGPRPPAGGSQVSLEVRPLIAPGVVVASSGPRSADPLRDLPFAVPNTEAAYDRLPAGQRQQLLAALARTDCARQSASAASGRVACDDPVGGARTAFLLGPSIFGREGVVRAEARSPGAVSSEWTVQITLDPTATAAWSRYTAVHHASDGSVADPARCNSSSLPCADFVAFLVNGRTLSMPLTLAPLGSVTAIAGNFTERTASAIAHELAP